MPWRGERAGHDRKGISAEQDAVVVKAEATADQIQGAVDVPLGPCDAILDGCRRHIVEVREARLPGNDGVHVAQ